MDLYFELKKLKRNRLNNLVLLFLFFFDIYLLLIKR